VAKNKKQDSGSEDLAILAALSRLEADSQKKIRIQSEDQSETTLEAEDAPILLSAVQDVVELSSGRTLESRSVRWPLVLVSILGGTLLTSAIAGGVLYWVKSEIEKKGTETSVDAWLISNGLIEAEEKESPDTALDLQLIRGQLEALADAVIVEGDRGSYVELVEYTKKPHEQVVLLAAQGQVVKLGNFFETSSRVKGHYFPTTLLDGLGVSSEEELSDSELARLLSDKETKWELRARCAWLLGGRGSNEALAALVRAIRTDEHLEVVKEATYSFQENTSFRAALFDFDSFEEFVAANTPDSEG
jgi:hypothetical protein